MPRMQYMAAALIILFFSGLKDDIIIISPFNKLIMQIFAAVLVVVLEGLRISNFGGIFGLYELPLLPSIIFSVFTLIVITNAFNLIDGIDGLAGGLSFIVSLTYSIWFFLIGEYNWATISFALSGAIFGFMFYNFAPAKIFMGDAGSLTIGFLISIFTFKFIEFGSQVRTDSFNLVNVHIIAVAILIVPLYDTLSVFIIRLYKKQSPFKADRNHIHHWLLKTGLSHAKASLVLYAVTISFICIAYFLRDNNIYVLASVIVGLAIILGQLPIYIHKHILTDILAETKDINTEIDELIKSKKPQ